MGKFTGKRIRKHIKKHIMYGVELYIIREILISGVLDLKFTGIPEKILKHIWDSEKIPQCISRGCIIGCDRHSKAPCTEVLLYI